jgi:hypothetical protein
MSDVEDENGRNDAADSALVADTAEGNDNEVNGQIANGVSLDPAERITVAALRMSAMTYERAFALDSHNLGKKLGEYTISRLTEILFDRIYRDPTEWFRLVHICAVSCAFIGTPNCNVAYCAHIEISLPE